MSKKNKKNKKAPPGSVQKIPKNVLKKAKLKYKQGKSKRKIIKMSDVSSEASSVQSLSVSGQSRSTAGSGPPLSSNKKLQCDLCKLSYSSDKELTEHLVSLMHHTKLDNKDENSSHNCVLCNIECKDMSDYRKHIGLSSHLQEIAYLKGEKVEKRKPNKSRWGPKVQQGEGHQFRSGNRFNNNYKVNSTLTNNNTARWNFNKNQQRYQTSRIWNQPSSQQNFNYGQLAGVDQTSMNGHKTMFAYQNFGANNYDYTQDWTSNNFYSPGSHTDPREKKCEPWGSGMYRGRYSSHDSEQFNQYERRGYHQDKREFQDRRFFDDNQFGHWDEHSLSEQEQFLASMDENSEGRDKFNWQKASMNVGSQRMYDTNRWGTGAKTMTHNPSSIKEQRLQQVLETSGQAGVDRKRPMQDESKDVSGSAAPKTSRSRIAPHSENKQEPVKRGETTTPSAATSSPDKLDSASDDLLLRAERLCKELRERRLASAQVNSSTVKTSQQETVLSEKLNAISQLRQQKYFRGIIKDVQDVSSADSGISTDRLSQDGKKAYHTATSSESTKVTSKPGLGKPRSLGEIRKSLEVAVKSPEDKEIKASKKRQKTRDETFLTIQSDADSPTLSKQGPHLCQRERRDSSSSTGSKQGLKAVVRPQVLSKDSLKKMINAPRSRDERVHLAKLLHSRDDAHQKSVVGSGTSRPLQLEGLYDSQSLYQDSAAESATSSDVTSTIKLEDLNEEVREQILALIGPNCPGLEELQLPAPVSKSSTSQRKPIVESSSGLSSTQESLSLSKKQDKVSKAKKSVINTEKKKEKAKKSASDGINFENSQAKDSKNTSTESLGTEYDKATNKKPKFSSSEIIDLIDSEEEQSSETVSRLHPGQAIGMKEPEVRTALKKKKKKKKEGAKEGNRSQCSSSLESDDILKEVHLSNKKEKRQESLTERHSHINDLVNHSRFKCPEKFPTGTDFDKEKRQESVLGPHFHLHKDSEVNLLSSKPSEKQSTFTGNANQVTQCEFDKEKNKEPLPKTYSHIHNRVLCHSSSKPFAKVPKSGGTLSKSQKSKPEAEPSLNSLNVREKYPLLMKSHAQDRPSPTPSTSPSPSTAALGPSTAKQTSKSSGVSTVNSSTATRPYAKAVAVSASTITPSSSSLAPSQSAAPLSSTPFGQMPSAQTVSLQLPPSIHLANRQCQPEASPTPVEAESDDSKAIWTKFEVGLKDERPVVKEGNVVVMDESDSAASGDDENFSLSSSAYSGETSNKAMAELLLLSEREEQIKQESMSMELRLTRLHRLLEQAVVQINKCTERRAQLQEEEKEISKKRLSLLRGIAKGKISGSSTTSVSQNQSSTIPSIETRNAEPAIDSVLLGKLATETFPASHSSALTATSSTSEKSQSASSLSRADWLAKFSSFLPPDPTREKENSAASGLPHSKSARYADLQQNQQLPDLDQRPRDTIDTDPYESRDEIYHGISSPASRGLDSGMVVQTPDATGSASMTDEMPAASSTKVLYVGTFLTPSAPVSKAKASSITHNKDENSGLIQSKDSVYNSRESQSLDRLQEAVVPLPEAKLYRSGSIGTGDDSDIGSVASSMASGTSLGEKISQYCRATPGASLDPPPPGCSTLRGVGATSRHQFPDLSIIISSDASLSDHHSESNQRGEDKEENRYSGSRGAGKGKIDLERSENTASRSDICRGGIYGGLNQEAVRSAEALHVMERNFQEGLKSKSPKDQGGMEDVVMLAAAHSPSKGSEVSLSDCATPGGGKRKKLLTRQEREASQLTRHRKRWLVASSSDEEHAGESETVASLLSPAGEARSGALRDKVDLGVIKTELVLPKQENIVVAECDSSTGLGLIDSESIRQRTKTLREMKESFEKTFGRSPRTKAALARDGELGLGVNSTTTEALSLTSKSTLSKGADIGGNSQIPLHDGRSDFPPTEDDVRDTGLQRFEGMGIPICEMQVVDTHLYVGYRNSCISVFDLEGSLEEPISEHPFGLLECFFVTEINDVLTVIVGNGCFLTFCSASDTQTPPQDMGTPIHCILYSDFELFLGLDTGEICVINTKTMEQRSRFICSDHSLSSMAVAQEGAMRLLCVAAQDGSISVINSRQGLLLRILPGHIRAAYSLQVDKSSVFSCSMDGTVLEQNLHTTTIEHVYKNHKGVKAIHLHKTYLLTAGEDNLVRCFDTKTHQLVQVNYGAGKGAISKIIVINNKLITGNMDGIVDVIDFNIDAQNRCPEPSCNLNFGHGKHLLWHQQQKQHFINSKETPTVIN
ncbi:hypothetical protein EGW08_006765 [Elysia chlorotica]|uniref:C2H2-type domain-containing protein n=1 Tax=Elysia chlorotica TaxID=188477 RepID=A0A3S1HSY4_ELYCH|nr:hypothetical protein EGW08_006765 [Elysia chlorotica]